MNLIREWFRLLAGNLPLWRQGERAAARLLAREKGYRVLVRNWRSPDDRRDELDLVCLDGRVLVFVEVKTRSASALVRGYHAVNRRKRTALRRAAFAYLKALGHAHRPFAVRFDIVEVETSFGRITTVRHLENVDIFGPGFRWAGAV